MSKLSREAKVWALVLVSGMFCDVASARTITIGTNIGGNVFPFSAAYSGEYQQAYSGTLFGGSPVDITAITFFPPSASPTSSISGNYSLDLSTTSAGILGLSTVYANNIGSDNALFFSGTLTNVLTIVGAPFLFDPSKGNLLLDVFTTSGIGRGLAAGCSTDTNRVFNFGGTGAPTIGNTTLCVGIPNSFGLETQFTFNSAATAVPEPSTLALFASGVLGLGALRRRRKAKA